MCYIESNSMIKEGRQSRAELCQAELLISIISMLSYLYRLYRLNQSISAIFKSSSIKAIIDLLKDAFSSKIKISPWVNAKVQIKCVKQY